MTQSTPLQRLLGIMKRLRDPENGCPWDKEQTFATIAPYTLEETYEVLDAISREDFDDLRGELGDLLFQVVFYAQMAQEEGRCSISTISALPSATSWSAVTPIFLATPRAETAKPWRRAGSRSRPLSGPRKRSTRRWTIFRRALPALMRAHKIQKRCSAVGFDWTSLGPVLDKVHEEIDEVMHEAQQAVVDESKAGRRDGRSAVCDRQPFSPPGCKSGNGTAKSQPEIRTPLPRGRGDCPATRAAA